MEVLSVDAFVLVVFSYEAVEFDVNARDGDGVGGGEEIDELSKVVESLIKVDDSEGRVKDLEVEFPCDPRRMDDAVRFEVEASREVPFEVFELEAAEGGVMVDKIEEGVREQSDSEKREEHPFRKEAIWDPHRACGEESCRRVADLEDKKKSDLGKQTCGLEERKGQKD